MNDPLDSAIYFVYKIIDNSPIFVKRFIYSGLQFVFWILGRPARRASPKIALLSLGSLPSPSEKQTLIRG